MHAASAILVVSLVSSTLGHFCKPRQKPYYDCNKGPRDGVFFPYPQDCTFLVVCLGHQHFVVSLCDETDHSNINDPKYSLGCPKKCDLIRPGCHAPTLPSSTTADPHADPDKHFCLRAGLIEHPHDCKKAFFCPTKGKDAMLFDICNNISEDSTFPVGCPELCPDWFPGIVSNPDTLRTV